MHLRKEHESREVKAAAFEREVRQGGPSASSPHRNSAAALAGLTGPACSIRPHARQEWRPKLRPRRDERLERGKKQRSRFETSQDGRWAGVHRRATDSRASLERAYNAACVQRRRPLAAVNDFVASTSATSPSGCAAACAQTLTHCRSGLWIRWHTRQAHSAAGVSLPPRGGSPGDTLSHLPAPSETAAARRSGRPHSPGATLLRDNALRPGTCSQLSRSPLTERPVASLAHPHARFHRRRGPPTAPSRARRSARSLRLLRRCSALSSCHSFGPASWQSPPSMPPFSIASGACPCPAPQGKAS